MGNKLARRRSSVDERYTKPQGLYQHRDIDHRKLRRLILDSKLAPCYVGAEDPAADLDECPICFLHYPSLNRSKCCTKGICTECYLQMKSPDSVRPTQCPYCKTLNYGVEYRGIKTEEEKGVEQVEEQRVIEAKIRIQQKELEEEQQQRTSGRFQTVFDSGHLQTDHSRDSSAVVEGDSSATAASYTARSTIMATVATVAPELPRYHKKSFLHDKESTSEEIFPVRVLSPEPAINTIQNSHIISSFGHEMHTACGQGSAGSSSAYMRQKRDEFDLDLEDIMVMEAIWLSLQEQGMEKFVEQKLQCPLSGDMSCVTSMPSLDSTRTMDLSANLFNSEEMSKRCLLTGGLASVIAEMAERHITGGTIQEMQSVNSLTEFSSLPTCSNLQQPDRPFQNEVLQMDDLNNLSEDAVDTVMCSKAGIGHKDVQNTDGKILKAQLRGNASMATAYSHVHPLSCQDVEEGRILKSDGSEKFISDSSECHLAQSTPEGSCQGYSNEVLASYDSGDTTLGASFVPKNFEDQMTLAMALSLREAQIDCQSQHVEEGNC